MGVTERDRERLAALKAKQDRLVNIDPFFIDLSLRENPVGNRIGQVLRNKQDILPKLREFGFKNILLGTLDYADSEEREVDDFFMEWVRDFGDLRGCWAFTDVAHWFKGELLPTASMLKLEKYQVPNTLHEIYLSPQGMQGQYTLAELKEALPRSVAWLHEHCHHAGRPGIIINIVDGCDAFCINPEIVIEMLDLIDTLDVDGLSFEDDRGTYMPFQVADYTAIARDHLHNKKLLVHVHSGAGFENASVIDALLAGADGVWGALPKRAAVIGHASLGELIANLMRARNVHMAQYKVRELLPLVHWLQQVDEEEPMPVDTPILGANAYRTTLDFFKQQDGRYMDLPAHYIGGTAGFRVAPVVSDPPTLAGRLAEVLHRPANSFPQDVLKKMVLLMRSDLVAGLRFEYDQPNILIDLYERAGGAR